MNNIVYSNIKQNWCKHLLRYKSVVTFQCQVEFQWSQQSTYISISLHQRWRLHQINIIIKVMRLKKMILNISHAGNKLRSMYILSASQFPPPQIIEITVSIQRVKPSKLKHSLKIAWEYNGVQWYNIAFTPWTQHQGTCLNY